MNQRFPAENEIQRNSEEAGSNPEQAVTTVLLQPESHCRVRTANHVTYSIDTKPPHLVRGSPL